MSEALSGLPLAGVFVWLAGMTFWLFAGVLARPRGQAAVFVFAASAALVALGIVLVLSGVEARRALMLFPSPNPSSGPPAAIQISAALLEICATVLWTLSVVAAWA